MAAPAPPAYTSGAFAPPPGAHHQHQPHFAPSGYGYGQYGHAHHHHHHGQHHHHGHHHHHHQGAAPAYGAPMNPHAAAFAVPRGGFGAVGGVPPVPPMIVPKVPTSKAEAAPLLANQNFLKALARTAKPCPPWCVGQRMTSDLSEEMALFDSFLHLSDGEAAELKAAFAALEGALRTVFPHVALSFAHSNAAGVFSYRAPLHVVATSTEEVSDAATARNLTALFKRSGFEHKAQFLDFRECTTEHLVHTATGVEFVLNHGAGSRRAVDAAAVIAAGFQSDVRRMSLSCLVSLLRQNKTIDDFNTATLSDEAVCIMVLSIVNSYADDDEPTAQRIILDFFLTFGFPEHFDTATASITAKGVAEAPDKVHPGDALSILDAGDERRNITAGVTADKLKYLATVFNYCFRVVSGFCEQNDPGLRRAQSPLSTIVGGEPYWPRVLELAAAGVPPYAGYVEAHWEKVHIEMSRPRPQRGGRR